MAPKRPNIVIFNPDQFRADALGHLGNTAAHTPNLDRTAAEDGVSFRNAFCQNTVCTPSRCSFMSGWYPHTAGHRTMYHMMHEHEPVLLRILKEQGYRVLWAGKNDLVPGQVEGIFDKYADEHNPRKPDPDKKYPNLHRDDAWRGEPDGDNYFSFLVGKLEEAYGIPTEEISSGDQLNVDAAVEFIKNDPGDRPYCIFLPLGYPHPPYGVEEPFFSMIDRHAVEDIVPVPDWAKKPSILKGIYDGQQMQGWDEARLKALRAVYHGMCARIDDQYGQVMSALKDAGTYDDTAVFFFSDHGDFTGDYGLVEKTQNTFEDCLSNVPFIIKPPRSAGVKARVSDALVELVDFPETVRALTGVAFRHTQFGKSLLPVLAGETDEHRDAAFCEGGRLYGEEHCMELQSKSAAGGYGLYSPRIRLQTTDDGPYHTKAVMCRTKTHKYTRRLYETDELYDLEKDPSELHNVIDDPAYANVLAALKERMLTFFMETGDAVPWDTDSR